MDNKPKNSNNLGNWIGVSTAIGVAVFAATNEQTWIAVGVAIGAALVSENQKIKMEINIPTDSMLLLSNG